VTPELAQVKDVYGKTLTELGEQNEKIFVVEADLMKASGTHLFKQRFPDRHINVGIAEQNLVGVAAGIAAAGGIPFACTMSNFISQRACDQVAMSVAYNCFNVKLVGCYAGLTQEKNGGTHISIMDLTVMRCLPNMTVMVPGDCKEYAQMLQAASRHVGPTYLRMPKLLAGSIFDTSHRFELGKAYVFGSGTDLTVITTGITTAIGFEALPLLEKERIGARILHLPTLKPLDESTVVDCAKATGAVLTIENHSRLGGLGSLISELLSKEYPVPVCRLGFDDRFGLTADLAFQLKYFHITAEDILENSKKLLRRK
jgi:transketolase